MGDSNLSLVLRRSSSGRAGLRSLFLLISMVMCLLAASLAQAEEVETFVLENGLKVVLVPAPMNRAVIVLRVNVGFSDEIPNADPNLDETGLAHWLEHSVFRGTPRHPNKGDFEKALDQLGIKYNASTSFERTNYFFITPSESLPDALEIFSDMISEPLLDPTELRSEVKPVIEEAKRDLENPAFIAFEASLALHAKSGRMRSLMTGTPEQIAAQPPESVRHFYDKHYSADNMTLVVAGGLQDLQAVKALVEKQFSKISRFPVEKRASNRGELWQPNPGVLKLYKVKHENESLRLLNIGFPLPLDRRSEGAMNLLVKYLNQRGEGTAFDVLKQAGFAYSAGVTFETYRDVMFMRVLVELTPEGEKNIAAVNGLVSSTFGALAKEGMPQHSLEEMKASYANVDLAEAGLLQVAEHLTDTAAVYGLNNLELPHASVLDSSNADIMRVAGYLRPENAQLTLLTPEAKGKVHPVVKKEVEEIDLSTQLPKFKKAYEEAKVKLPAEPISIMHPGSVGRAKDAAHGIDLVVVPSEQGNDIVLEFKYPRVPMDPINLVAIELAMAAFELDPVNEKFMSDLAVAGIDLEFRFDKSEMSLLVKATGDHRNAYRALESFIVRMRTFKPSAYSLELAKAQLEKQWRGLPASEVSRQAVSMGIKELMGREFLDLSQKIDLLKQIDLNRVGTLIKLGQQRWAVRGVLSTTWEDATVERFVGMLVAPQPKKLTGSVRLPEPRLTQNPGLIARTAAVKRQGVARLMPVTVEAFSRDQYAFEIFAHIASKRLMDVVRTELGLVYAVQAGFVVLPRGGVLWMAGDTSEHAQKMRDAFDKVTGELMTGATISDDEYNVAKREVIESFAGSMSGAEGLFRRTFENVKGVQKLAQSLGTMKKETMLKTVLPQLAASKVFDSVAAGPNDPICQLLLTGKAAPGPQGSVQ